MSEPTNSSTVCPACGYAVGEGPIERCPECGASTASFAAIVAKRGYTRFRWAEWCVYVFAGWPFLCFAAINGMLFVARIQLGRWPHRYGMDDPSHIPIVNVLGWVVLLLMYFIPVTALVGVVLWGVLVYSARKRRGEGGSIEVALATRRVLVWRVIRAGGIGPALWVGGMLFLIADPAEALVWWFD